MFVAADQNHVGSIPFRKVKEGVLATYGRSKHTAIIAPRGLYT